MVSLLALLICQPALDDTTTPGAREFKLAEVPVLDYSPETNGMVGAGLLLSSVHPALSNPLQSSAGALAFVTFNGQWGVNAFSHFYLDRDRYLLRFQAALFDGDHFFFGVGDSPTVEATTFDITDRNVELALLRRVAFRELFVGPLVRYQRVNAPGQSVSVLAGETAPDGASLLGAGGQVLWDGRDRALRTSQGIYASARSLFYGAGSAFDHFEGTLDVRGFTPLGNDWVLAVQAMYDVRRGEVPFFSKAFIGASDRLRGTFVGRFRDDAALYGRGELRSPEFWWHFSAVAFGGVGSVAPRTSELFERRGVVTVGAGLRLMLGEDGANARRDIGLGPDGESTTYFALGEAF